MTKVTDEEFREAGFTKEARMFPRSQLQLRMFAAYNGIDLADMPKAWHYFPNQHMKDAWERVERDCLRYGCP